MKIFLDSSIFLRLLLDEHGADEAQRILEDVEANRVLAYTTPLVLEEVSFKLLIAEASSRLNAINIWRIRESLRANERLRGECFKVLEKFSEYIEYLLTRGLRVEGILYSDWLKGLEYVRKYGLLTADAINLMVALRLGVNAIATFDEDFKPIEGVRVIP